MEVLDNEFGGVTSCFILIWVFYSFAFSFPFSERR